MQIQEFLLLEQLVTEEEQELEEAGFWDKITGRKNQPTDGSKLGQTPSPAPTQPAPAPATRIGSPSWKETAKPSEPKPTPTTRNDHLILGLKVGNQMIVKGAAKINEPKFFDQRIGHGQIIEGLVNIYDLIAREATNAPKAQSMAAKVRDNLGAAYRALGLVAEK